MRRPQRAEERLLNRQRVGHLARRVHDEIVSPAQVLKVLVLLLPRLLLLLTLLTLLTLLLLTLLLLLLLLLLSLLPLPLPPEQVAGAAHFGEGRRRRLAPQVAWSR